MSEEVKVDFASGDTIPGEEIVKCRVCLRPGVLIKTHSDYTYMVEHVIIWTTRKSRDRFTMIDGCYRQGRVTYKGSP